MKSTIINSLVLCFQGIYAAIPASFYDTLAFDDLSIIYQTSTIIFLPLIVFWDHKITQQTNSEYERENRRRLVYDEARDRRAEIETKRVQRTQEQTYELERIERYRVQALKGEFGMYGGDDSDSEIRDVNDKGFHNIELKSPSRRSRYFVYDEARRVGIAAKRVQRTQEQTFEMESNESYRVQALKGELGMYGGDDSNLQDGRTSKDYMETEFQNVDLKSPDYYLWI